MPYLSKKLSKLPQQQKLTTQTLILMFSDSRPRNFWKGYSVTGIVMSEDFGLSETASLIVCMVAGEVTNLSMTKIFSIDIIKPLQVFWYTSYHFERDNIWNQHEWDILKIISAFFFLILRTSSSLHLENFQDPLYNIYS